jgi:hypothetical protein
MVCDLSIKMILEMVVKLSAKWYSACVAYITLWVQSPASLKKNILHVYNTSHRNHKLGILASGRERLS